MGSSILNPTSAYYYDADDSLNFSNGGTLVTQTTTSPVTNLHHCHEFFFQMTNAATTSASIQHTGACFSVTNQSADWHANYYMWNYASLSWSLVGSMLTTDGGRWSWNVNSTNYASENGEARLLVMTQGKGAGTYKPSVTTESCTLTIYYPTGNIMWHNGSTWVSKPVYYYDGATSTWKQGALYFHNGTTWVETPY